MILRKAMSAAVLFGCLSGAAADRALDEAQRLLLAGAKEQAITEYKRYLFFNPDSPAVPVYLRIAETCRNRGDYSGARQAFERALSYPISDSLRDAIRIKSAILDIADGRYRAAQVELIRLASFSTVPPIRNRANFFLCFDYVMMKEWRMARNIAREASAAGDSRLRIIDSIISSDDAFSRKSPGAAKYLSTVLPGLGQIYSHDVRNGFNALAISGITGFMTLHSVLHGYYQEALLTDITLFWRYYSGNRWGAMKAAESYNEKKDRRIQKKIMASLGGRE